MGYGGGGYGGGGYGRGGNGGGYGGGGRRPFEKKDGEGRLFEENQKKGPNSPDFSGYIIVNGQEIKISGWGKSGQRGFSINLKVKQGNQMMPDGGGQSFGGYPQAPQPGFGGPQQPAYGHEGVPYQPPRGQQQPQGYGPAGFQAPANARPFPGPQQPAQGGWAPPQGQAQASRYQPNGEPRQATSQPQQPAQTPAGGVGYGQPPGQDFSPPPEPDDGKLPF